MGRSRPADRTRRAGRAGTPAVPVRRGPPSGAARPSSRRPRGGRPVILQEELVEVRARAVSRWASCSAVSIPGIRSTASPCAPWASGTSSPRSASQAWSCAISSAPRRPYARPAAAGRGARAPRRRARSSSTPAGGGGSSPARRPRRRRCSPASRARRPRRARAPGWSHRVHRSGRLAPPPWNSRRVVVVRRARGGRQGEQHDGRGSSGVQGRHLSPGARARTAQIAPDRTVHGVAHRGASGTDRVTTKGGSVAPTPVDRRRRRGLRRLAFLVGAGLLALAPARSRDSPPTMTRVSASRRATSRGARRAATSS